MNTKFLITISILIAAQTALPMTHKKTQFIATIKKHAKSFSTSNDRYAATVKISDGSGHKITIWDAVDKGNAHATRFLLDAGVNPNAHRIQESRQDDNEHNLRNKSKTLLGQALKFGWKWNKFNNSTQYQYKAAHWSFTPEYTHGNHRSIIRMLLMRGANPCTRDTCVRDDGFNLRDAVPLEHMNDPQTSDAETITRLLEHGTDLLERNKDNVHTPLYNHDDRIEALLGQVSHFDLYDKNGPLYRYAYALSLSRAQSRPQQQHPTWKDFDEMVNPPCVPKDLNLHKTTAYGANVLHWAVRTQNHRALQNILFYERDFAKWDKLAQQDLYGLTPLHWAIYGRPAIVETLLENGARLDIKDSYMQTPLDIAKDCGTPEMVYMLR